MDTKTDAGGMTRNLDRTIERASDRAHQAVDRAAGAASSITDRLNEHVDALSEKGEELRAMPENWMEGARDYVREHPVAALGIALAAGYLFSMMMRNK